MFNIFKKIEETNNKRRKIFDLCGKNNITDEEDIFYCFRIILGRDPNPEEIKGHLGAGIGKPLENVVKSYLNSLEFNKRDLFLKNNQVNLFKANFNGKTIYLNNEDPNIAPAIINGSFEKDIVRFVKRNLKKNMTFLDVGANVGFYSFLASSIVGDNGKIIAIEPNLENVKLMYMTMVENSYKNIKLLPLAAGDENGFMLLNVSYSNGTTSKNINSKSMFLNSIIVPSLKLDNIINEKIDFMKIDVEGAEFMVLNGLKHNLEIYKPIIISEFSPNSMPGISGVTGIEYLDFIRTFGYKIYIIDDEIQINTENHNNESIMNYFLSKNVDHIDICATTTFQ